MFNILVKYLVLNRHLNLPGIGFFKVVDAPARFDHSSGMVHAPSSTIHFTDNPTVADRHFFDFVAQQLNAEQTECVRQFHHFTHLLSQEVNTKKLLALPGIGLLTKSNNGVLQFQPVSLYGDYFPAISFNNGTAVHHQVTIKTEEPANELYATEAQEIVEQTRKNRWWIAALALAVLSIVAIIWYHVNTGQEL